MGVQMHNSLSYAPGDPTFNPEVPSDIESVIDQVGRLRDLDPTASNDGLVVAPQVGIVALDSVQKRRFLKTRSLFSR